jgi:hypothetical protein
MIPGAAENAQRFQMHKKVIFALVGRAGELCLPPVVLWGRKARWASCQPLSRREPTVRVIADGALAPWLVDVVLKHLALSRHLVVC